MPDLIRSSYFFLSLLEIALCAALALNFSDILSVLKGIPRRHWFLLAAAFLAGTLLRFFFAPHRHYVFYDEYEHIAVARNMLENASFSRCDFYLDGKCLSSWLPQWVPGYHFLLSQFFALSGATGPAAFAFNSLISSFSIPLVFLLTYFAFQNAVAATLSGLLTAFLPLHLKFAGNASTETASLFFLLLAIASWFFFARRRSGRSLFLVFSATAWALMLRVENGLLLALLPLFIIMFGPDRRALSALWFLPVIAVPYLVYLPHIRAFMLGNWLGPREHISGCALFWSAVKYWSADISVPVILVMAAMASVFVFFKERKAEVLFLVVYFLSFVSAYTCVEKLDLSNTDSQRFNLVLVLPVLVLSSVFLSRALALNALEAWLNRKFQSPENRQPIFGLKHIAGFLLLIALTADYAKCLAFVKAEISAQGFVGDYSTLLAGQRVGKAAVYVAYAPAFPIAALQASSVHISYMSDENIFETYLKGRELILLDDFWCRRDPENFCAALKKRFHIPQEQAGPAEPRLRLYPLR